MNHSSRLSFLAAGLVLLGAGCGSDAPPKPDASKPVSERPAAEAPSPAPSDSVASAPSQGLREMRAVDFPLITKAERFINENQGKKLGSAGYETIVDMVVADPDKAGTYYFATSAYDAATGENFVGVYSMEETSYNWWRAYKHTYKRGDDGSAPAQLRVVGKSGSMLYLVADKVGAIRADETLISDIGPLHALDLDKPLDGLKELKAVPPTLEGKRI